MFARLLRFLLPVLPVASPAVCGDEALYRFEGNVFPFDESAGWRVGRRCQNACSETIGTGAFKITWPEDAEVMGHSYRITTDAGEPFLPSTLWVEWQFRSNQRFDGIRSGCDARFYVLYRNVVDLVDLFGDAVISFSGDEGVVGLDIDSFHTYRFESPDGLNYRFSVDGNVFVSQLANASGTAAWIQIYGQGGCHEELRPTINEWDFVRYGTISYGERVVASDPPAGFLDARRHADLDCFAVAFDSPNYVYINEITAESFDLAGTPVAAPVVTATRRSDESETATIGGVVVNRNAPDTVEIVLDRPIPMPGTTRFTINDGVAINVIEYTFAPGDTDGDGRVTLRDVSYFQSCLSESTLIGPCRAVDLIPNGALTLADFKELQALLSSPLQAP